jgi:hypothetical protein
LIQRFLLPARPAYGFTAGLRGGGKTTLAHLLTMALFHRMAAATAWSKDQEERRKALLAFYLAGLAQILFDNIATGTEIACPEVERALTSPLVQDRILGVSKGGIAATYAILFFVGNNLSFGGDMASRGLLVRLLTDNPNPEDRPYTHQDPLAWTRDHRAEILRCLYTLLVYGCRVRPAEQREKTRFTTWWSLVGWPVELAASLLEVPLDFSAVFKETEATDSKANGVMSALGLLRDTFGEGEFGARDIRALLDVGETARDSYRRTGINSNEPAIRKQAAFLEMHEVLTGKRNRSPITEVLGRALAGIADRPVKLDDTTVGILRAKISRGNTRFSVEVRGGERSSTPTATRWESGSFAPPCSTTFIDPVQPVVVEHGGAKGTFSDRARPPTQEFSPPAPTKKRRKSAKNAETPPNGEWITEVWGADE